MAESEAAIANLALLRIGDSKGLLDDFDGESNQAQVCKLLYGQERDNLLRAFKWPFATRRAYPTQLGGAAWVSTTPYGVGDYASYAPAIGNVVNPPESLTTFVYLSLVANNTGNAPDSNPGSWLQISRAAWAYAFSLPADLLRVIGLYHGNRNPREDQQVPYAIEYESAQDATGNVIGPGKILLTDAGLPWESWALSTAPRSIELVYTAQITDTKQFPPDFTETLSWRIASMLALALRKDADEARRCSDAATSEFSRAVAHSMQEVRPDRPPLPSFIAARRGRRGWR
jgi:hypothetical protein